MPIWYWQNHIFDIVMYNGVNTSLITTIMRVIMGDECMQLRQPKLLDNNPLVLAVRYIAVIRFFSLGREKSRSIWVSNSQDTTGSTKCQGNFTSLDTPPFHCPRPIYMKWSGRAAKIYNACQPCVWFVWILKSRCRIWKSSKNDS